MSWPAASLPLIGTWSRYGLVGSGTSMNLSSNWTTNLAVYVPVTLPMAVQVKKLWWVNGSSVTGNIDVGIYDAQGNKIVSTGSIAPGTASQVASSDIADLTLPPGDYYFAGWRANTGRFGILAVISAGHAQVLGVRQEASLASGLPDTASFATPSTALVPILGVDTAGVT